MEEDHTKMWYSIKEAAIYLNIGENKLVRKITGLNIEMKRLPGKKEEFLARKDVLDLKRMIKS